MPPLSQQGYESQTQTLDFELEYHDPTFKVRPENADPLRYSKYARDLVDTLAELEPNPLSDLTEALATDLHEQVTKAAPADRELFRPQIDDMVRMAWAPYQRKVSM